MKTIVSYLKDQQGKILQYALIGTIGLFIAIMIGVYLIAREANPIILDEQGRPLPRYEAKPGN